MKTQLLILSLFCLFSLPALTQSISRSSIVTTGDFTTSNNYSLSWSVGELSAYSTLQNSHHLTGGFQQGELQTAANRRAAAPPTQEGYNNEYPLFKQTPNEQVKVSVYPNPTMHQLSLDLDGFAESNGHLLILDASAKPVITQHFDLRNQHMITIDQVEALAPGKYFLQIYQQGTIKWTSSFLKI